MVDVEILYVEGCLNVEKARSAVEEAIRRGRLEDVRISETLVRGGAHVRELGLPGTPTVRVNGKDVAEDGAKDVGTRMRTYEFNGILMGHPPWDVIAEAVREAQESSRDPRDNHDPTF